MNKDKNKLFKLNYDFIKSFYRLIKEHSFSGKYNDLKDKPESLKNPHKLKFTGAIDDDYDGSEDKTVEIPELIEDEQTRFSINESYDISTNTSAQEKEIISQAAKDRISSSVQVTRDLVANLKKDYLQTANSENPAINQVLVTNGSDNKFRKASVDHLKAYVGTRYMDNTGGFITAAPGSPYNNMYMKIATFTTNQYQNSYFAFTIYRRGGESMRCCINLNEQTGLLYKFRAYFDNVGYSSFSDPNQSASRKLYIYIVTVSTSGTVGVYDIYVFNHPWSNIRIANLYAPFCSLTLYGSNSTSISSTSLPSGALEPTIVTVPIN